MGLEGDGGLEEDNRSRERWKGGEGRRGGVWLMLLLSVVVVGDEEISMWLSGSSGR